ncbi:MAG: NAD-dependent dehydratase [Candidatus Hydrogenedentota bacterium]|nr:MAG: NAD-dependent dehydratase [Candidatus Hydrogenedentota bacterium]
MGRVVISGGAGFLPSHLCDRLLAEGHEVVALDNFITGRRENVAHLMENPGFTLVEQDVSEPFTVDGEADYVMHMASPASPPDFKTIPFETLKAGSYGSHNMLEIARQKGARFFLASTSEVYGDPPPEHHPQVEEYWGNVNPNGPRSVYDEAKRYAEAVTMAYHREYDLEVRIVRIFNTYGPRMRPDDGRVVTNFITQALNNESLTLYGDGSQTRSFTYVSETADGIYRLLMSDESTPVNIGNPNECTMRELAENVIKLTGAESTIVCVEQPFSDDPKQRRPDISKAKRVLDWEPTIPLSEGLQKTIDYVRKEIAVRSS